MDLIKLVIFKWPGDLVQVDTLDVRPFPWVTLKQFTARDVVSRWDVLEARRRATAITAREFIETLERRMPFKVRALQVDGGSEFYSDLEEECHRRRLRLFIYLRRVQSSMAMWSELKGLIQKNSTKSMIVLGMSQNSTRNLGTGSMCIKINTDENPNWATKYGVRGIPTMLFIKGGKEVDRQVGAVPKQFIANKLAPILA